MHTLFIVHVVSLLLLTAALSVYLLRAVCVACCNHFFSNEKQVAAELCCRFTKQQLLVYVYTRSWNHDVVLPSRKCKKMKAAQFIVEHYNDPIKNKEECLVCFERPLHVAVHSCRQCSFKLCLLCESKLTVMLNRCPQCKCLICNARLHQFVKKRLEKDGVPFYLLATLIGVLGIKLFGEHVVIGDSVDVDT